MRTRLGRRLARLLRAWLGRGSTISVVVWHAADASAHYLTRRLTDEERRPWVHRAEGDVDQWLQPTRRRRTPW